MITSTFYLHNNVKENKKRREFIYVFVQFKLLWCKLLIWSKTNEREREIEFSERLQPVVFPPSFLLDLLPFFLSGENGSES